MKTQISQIENRNSRIMNKLITMITAIAIVSLTSGCSNDLSDTYYGSLNGANVECNVVQNGNMLSGTLSDGNSTFQFKGSFSQNQSQGTMVANGTTRMAYSAAFNGNSCTFTINPPQGNGAPLVISLSTDNGQSSGSNTQETAPSLGEIDQNIVGRWMMESSASTSGSAEYASFVSVKYYQFNADGTYTITDGGSAGGGDGYGYSSGASGDVNAGTWCIQDGLLHTAMNGGTAHNCKYTFSDGKLVLGSKGSYSFLSPAN